MARNLPYILLDVFTDRPLTGNQLAVFPDAQGLGDAEMQAMARETRLPETTFVFPRDAGTERERGIKVRIFTTDEELPFAGHPTLGTANVLRGRAAELGSPGLVKLDLKVGAVPVQFEDRGGPLPFGEMRQQDAVAGQVHDRETVARLTGLPLDAIDANLPIQTFSTGLPFAIVPLRTLAQANALDFSFGGVREYLSRSDARFFYFVTRQTTSPEVYLHARMIFYNGEDPATGSAAGACAAWMAAHGVAPSEQQVIIEQGIEMQRPSRIFVRAKRVGDDKVVNVHVGGYCVEIARGTMQL
jgi:trans-2,3-dihydro-3-hydroxyanthranilate isomerase